MKLKGHPEIKVVALYAILFLLISVILPIFFLKSANFLGKDVSQIAIGIVGFYPMTAIWEAIKIILLAMTSSSLLTWLFFNLLRSARFRLIKVMMCMIVFHLILFVGAVVEFPGFYEVYLPSSWKILLWRMAAYINPLMVYKLAIATVGILLCYAVVKENKSGFLTRHRVKSTIFLMLILGVASLFLTIKIPANDSVKIDHKPNILFIAIDSLRYDRLEKLNVLPSIAKLIDDDKSVLMKSHYVGIPRTFPSWIEILEGRYASETGVRHMFPGFGERNLERDSFVSIMRHNGYKTSVVSDFAGDIFPRFLTGFERVNTPTLSISGMIRLSIDQMFPVFLPIFATMPLIDWFKSLHQSPAFADPKKLTHQLKAEMLAEDGPWLKVAFFSTAHFPYAAPYPYYRMFSDPNYNGRYLFAKNPETKTEMSEVTDQDIRQVQALYDGALRSIDDQLGELFRFMKSRGIWDNTMVILTADHGEEIFDDRLTQGHGEHLWGDHVLHVPLVIKYSKGAPVRQRKVEFITRTIDIAPTVLGAMGYKISNATGNDLTGWIAGLNSIPPHNYAYSETGIWFSKGGRAKFQNNRLNYPGISGLLNFDQGNSDEVTLDARYEHEIITAKHRAINDGMFKIVYMPTSEGVKYELFDVVNDPQNLVDVKSKNLEKFKEMRNMMLSHIERYEYRGTLVEDFWVPQ